MITRAMPQLELDARAVKETCRVMFDFGRQSSGTSVRVSCLNSSVIASNNLLDVELTFDHSDQRDANNGVHFLSLPVNVPLPGKPWC